MSKNLHEKTNEFIKYLYKDKNSSAGYLHKKGSELRTYLKNGQNLKPLVVKFNEWCGEPIAETAPIVDTTITNNTIPTPQVQTETTPMPSQAQKDLEAQVRLLTKQVEYHKNKKNIILKKFTSTMEKLENTEKNFETFKKDYKDKCFECNKLYLKLESKGMAKDLVQEHDKFKQFYKHCNEACSCGAADKFGT
eukprot:SAG31_NODE_652_length_13181_cov_14.268155_8_plen_193_part_00